ncbi:MAG TPA: endonuclease/exonuclease/phosphatase family protein [Nocardioides sp.]|nr:endonuclease/exonuclease/phosphatase family protein [Nocardioides sp.]
MSPAVRKLFTSMAALTASALAVLGPTLSAVPASSTSGSTFSVLQMNLCLSGQAGCYDSADQPAILDEAAAQVAEHDPSAVTLNETCRADAAELARRAGYHLSFATVDYGGAPLPCIDPRGRGVFGIAVLTRDDVAASRDRAFGVQADPEERRWLCAITDRGVTVCTAHLSTRYSAGERAANDAGCRELQQVLARQEAVGTTFFGGDVNRQSSCAPATMWATQDAAASQSAGVQHVYGSGALDPLSVSVAEASYTDHDFLFAAASAR